MQIKDILKQYAAATTAATLAYTPQDVEVLLSTVLKVPRSYLYSHAEEMVSDTQYADLQTLLRRLSRGEPLAYVLGNCEFWTLQLKVDYAVLIPRPETELLVENALSHLNHAADLTIAELGTGCGAIALALAKECPRWQVHATDISRRALDIAHHNAEQLKLGNVIFSLGDWYAALPAKQKFSAIISNPPYVGLDDPNLQQNVKEFEPPLALFSGSSGLNALRTIIAQAPRYLEPHGWLMLEHGFEQGARVRELMSGNGFAAVTTHKDLSGHERITVGQRPQENKGKR
jgi:release factor glutamine methyltransferase